MKAVQVILDEPLLRRLDANDEVRKRGRSAVLRQAAAEYLRRHRAKATADAYRKAYGGRAGLDDEFRGWEDEGAWPER